MKPAGKDDFVLYMLPKCGPEVADENNDTSMVIEGFGSTSELVNSEVDEKQGEISSFSKWRGIGDASSNGVWKFRKGLFVLADFDVDPTYNEEMDPISVMKDGKIVYSP